MKKFIKYFLYVSLFLVMFAFCGGAFLHTTSLFSSLPAVDEGNKRIPNNEFFYVRIADASYRGRHGFDLLDYEMYEKESGPGYDCKIPVNSEGSTEDMFCMFEVMEADLFLHKLEFEYNTPPGMCDYIKYETHWHYNQASGQGPLVICEKPAFEGNSSVYCTSDFTPPTPQGLCSDTDKYGGCRSINVGQHTEQVSCYEREVKKYCADAEPETGECNRDPPTRACTDDVIDLCKYNHKEDVNCCIGEYEIKKAGVSDDEQKKIPWGGDLKNCIGGLGRIAWEVYTGDGLPRPIITTAKDGLRQKYEIPPIIEVLGQKKKQYGYVGPYNSFVTANYWEGIEDNTDVPDFYKPSRQPNIPWDGYPYITFTCLDQAYEPRHRIHLIIREWNSLEEFKDFKDSQGSSGDPDVVGASGSDCDYYEEDEERSQKDTECNDLKDANDWEPLPDESHPVLEYTN